MVNIHDIAKYTILRLLQNGNTITPLKLQKVLYYLQAWYMVYFDKELLFENEPEAWVNGPVYRDIYEEYKRMGIYDQFSMSDFGLKPDEVPDVLKDLKESMYLSQDRWNLIEDILRHYGSMSQDRLVFLTHSQRPWNDARRGVQPFAYSEEKISLDSMFDYYSHSLKR